MAVDPLRFGMQLPGVAKSPYFAQPWELEAGPAEMEAIARAADRSGFFYLAVCDHVAVPKAAVPLISAEWYDPVATLGWLSGFTSRVRLLSHVLVAAYRNPLLTAKAFASLDQLSGGRVILGVGAGHLREEFAALGVPYEQRGSLTDEALDVIRAAWDQELVSVRTPHWTFEDLAVAPHPRQASVPIWIGGSSRPALRRAARRGDGWLPEGTPVDQLPPLIDYLRAERSRWRPDDPLDIGAGVSVRLGDTADEEPGVLAGHAEQLAERLRSIADLGVNHLQLRFPTGSASEQVEQVLAFGEAVGPLLGP